LFSEDLEVRDEGRVKRELDYVCAEIPPEIQELIEGQLLKSDAREEVGTQSSQAIAQTP
jgi:hypothetical protein